MYIHCMRSFVSATSVSNVTLRYKYRYEYFLKFSMPLLKKYRSISAYSFISYPDGSTCVSTANSTTINECRQHHQYWQWTLHNAKFASRLAIYFYPLLALKLANLPFIAPWRAIFFSWLSSPISQIFYPSMERWLFAALILLWLRCWLPQY